MFLACWMHAGLGVLAISNGISILLNVLTSSAADMLVKHLDFQCFWYARCMPDLEFLTVFNNFKSFGKMSLWRSLFYEHIFLSLPLLLQIIMIKLEKNSN